MSKIKENKFIPLILTFLNLGFWICFRFKWRFFKKHPVASLIKEPWLQLFIFIVLGITLTWLFCHDDSKKINGYLKSLGTGIGFMVFQLVYNIFSGDPPVYRADFFMMLAGLAIGPVIFYLIDQLFPHSESIKNSGAAIALDSLSTYRDPLMGIAMLYVILFHLSFLNVKFDNKLIDFFISSGNAGVDIFIFLSGLGMIYSLSKNFNIKEFYKKRISRIFPAYIPLVGLYTLVCMRMGLCGIRLLLTNCAGISFWFSSNPCAFNWYVPGILVFYLFTPGIFLLLKNDRARYRNAIILCSLSVLLLIVNIDFIEIKRLNVAISRFPVFIIGMLAGFWLLEKKSITKTEYYSLFPLYFLCVFLSYAKGRWHIPLIGWNWLPDAFIIPIFCLVASRIMRHVKADSVIMKFLSWTGKNSFLIYLLNIIIVRFIRMFFLKNSAQMPLAIGFYAFISTVLDLLLVYLYTSFKKYLISKKKNPA